MIKQVTRVTKTYEAEKFLSQTVDATHENGTSRAGINIQNAGYHWHLALTKEHVIMLRDILTNLLEGWE